MNIDKVLTDEAKNKIKKAVQDAEKKSGGEIVVFIAPQSDAYSYIYWAAGFLSTILGIFIFALISNFFQFTDFIQLIILCALFLFPLAVICLLYLIKPLRLLLIDNDKIDYYIHLKAGEAFLKEEVFNTKDRTGVLIYISLFERKAVVLGDSGINKKVNSDKWKAVIKAITKDIKNKSLTHGIVAGISACGNILKENNVKRRSKDKNELKDSIRIGGKK
jgi:putative membrane protein